ncbi:LutC/YkgG family protein [Consotaella salsifontis]|uniref:L-lactate dehydrogenase complex protein LldG n=1 Tax=Consotaella salsifontis TaxID=1365950 RepID=A0A1T4L333_9HYPH|nr:lactate utilization protein [Consotaella salsifontis]SJZ48947.1 L-lactate dehydrogenase complex protein LldG [Consotaella salsifontis]
MATSPRETMLARIRQAAAGGVSQAERRKAVAARLAEHPKGIVPARGQIDREGRVALFTEMAGRAGARVQRIATYDALPGAVADWLRAANLPAEVIMSGDPRLAAAPFETTALSIRNGASDGSDLTGLSHAEGAIAESGTLVVLSGPDNPNSLNYLPDNHLVALSADDVEGAMEPFWQRLRMHYGEGAMPRSVNLITGPSRSADIEQTLLIGAHGPRELVVFLIG